MSEVQSAAKVQRAWILHSTPSLRKREQTFVRRYRRILVVMIVRQWQGESSSLFSAASELPLFGSGNDGSSSSLLLLGNTLVLGDLSRMGGRNVGKSRARIDNDDINMVVDDDRWLLGVLGRSTEDFHTRHHSTAFSSPRLAWAEPPPLALTGPQNGGDIFPQQQQQTTMDKLTTTRKEEKHYNYQHRHYTSTGTTIVGVAGPDFVVVAADSRATAGTIVADKRCFKLHPLSSNCVAAGAGTSADIDHLTRTCCYAIRLIQQQQQRQGNDGCDFITVTTRPTSTVSSSQEQGLVSVEQVCRYLQERLYERGGTCQANLIVGGVNSNGKAVLRAIHPHGSMDAVSYTALGSGGLAAMGVLESYYDNIYNETGWTVDDAVALAVQAVKAGIDHDLGSGSQVDICTIRGPNGASNFTRCYVPEETLQLRDAVDDDDSVQGAGKSSPVGVVFEARGVNGFGNLPYAIRSKRILQISQERREQEVQEIWNDILVAGSQF